MYPNGPLEADSNDWAETGCKQRTFTHQPSPSLGQDVGNGLEGGCGEDKFQVETTEKREAEQAHCAISSGHVWLVFMNKCYKNLVRRSVATQWFSMRESLFGNGQDKIDGKYKNEEFDILISTTKQHQ